MATRRWTAATGAAVMVFAGAQVATASSAAAFPLNCQVLTNTPPGFVSSSCTAGTGEHRIVTTQRSPNPMNPFPLTVVGSWVPVGQLSSVQIIWVVENTWIDKR